MCLKEIKSGRFESWLYDTIDLINMLICNVFCFLRIRHNMKLHVNYSRCYCGILISNTSSWALWVGEAWRRTAEIIYKCMVTSNSVVPVNPSMKSCTLYVDEHGGGFVLKSYIHHTWPWIYPNSHTKLTATTAQTSLQSLLGSSKDFRSRKAAWIWQRPYKTPFVPAQWSWTQRHFYVVS